MLGLWITNKVLWTREPGFGIRENTLHTLHITLCSALHTLHPTLWTLLPTS
jgi:hypothetical protein